MANASAGRSNAPKIPAENCPWNARLWTVTIDGTATPENFMYAAVIAACQSCACTTSGVKSASSPPATSAPARDSAAKRSQLSE